MCPMPLYCTTLRYTISALLPCCGRVVAMAVCCRCTISRCTMQHACVHMHDCTHMCHACVSAPCSSATKSVPPANAPSTHTSCSHAACTIITSRSHKSEVQSIRFMQVVEKLYRERVTRMDGLGGLVLTPTRELAMQIFEELKKASRVTQVLNLRVFHDWGQGQEQHRPIPGSCLSQSRENQLQKAASEPACCIAAGLCKQRHWLAL